MKRKHIIFAIISVILLAFGSACKKTYKVNSVQVFPKEANMYIGDSLQIRASINYEGATVYDDPSILVTTWTSTKPNVASVTNKGKVKGLSQGEAIIIFDCDGVKDSTNLIVLEKPID